MLERKQFLQNLWTEFDNSLKRVDFMLQQELANKELKSRLEIEGRVRDVVAEAEDKLNNSRRVNLFIQDKMDASDRNSEEMYKELISQEQRNKELENQLNLQVANLRLKENENKRLETKYFQLYTDLQNCQSSMSLRSTPSVTYTQLVSPAPAPFMAPRRSRYVNTEND